MDKTKADQKSKASLPTSDKTASNANLPAAKDNNKSDKVASVANLPASKDNKNPIAEQGNAKGKDAKKGKDDKNKKIISEPEQRPAYLTYPVDASEFNHKYDKFLSDDKENKNNQAQHLSDYHDHSGLTMAFKLICAEVISHNMDRDAVLEYAAKRFKEIGVDLTKIHNAPGHNTATSATAGKDPKAKDTNVSQVAPSNPSTANAKR